MTLREITDELEAALKELRRAEKVLEREEPPTAEELGRCWESVRDAREILSRVLGEAK